MLLIVITGTVAWGFEKLIDGALTADGEVVNVMYVLVWDLVAMRGSFSKSFKARVVSVGGIYVRELSVFKEGAVFKLIILVLWVIVILLSSYV